MMLCKTDTDDGRGFSVGGDGSGDMDIELLVDIDNRG